MVSPQTAIAIKNQCEIALSNANSTTDPDQKYEFIREGYAALRTLQEQTQETNYEESPMASMEEYITVSLTSIDKILSTMTAAAAGDEYVPNVAAIDGLVMIPTGGSGSGSGSGV